jgi:hypothetical protein
VHEATDRAPAGDREWGASALPALKRLAAALRTCGLYHLRHPHTSTAIAQFLAVVAGPLEAHGLFEVEIARASFTFPGDSTERDDADILPLVSSLHARALRRLAILPGVDASEVRRLLEILITPPAGVRHQGGIENVLRTRGVRHIVVRELLAPVEEPLLTHLAPDDRARAMVILQRFIAAGRNVRLYRGGHLTVERTIGELFAALIPALAVWGSVRYDVRDGAVFIGQDILDDDAVFVAAFASDCAARGVGSLTFARGLTRAELARVVALFAREPEELIVEGGFVDALRGRRLEHVSAAAGGSA